MKTKHFGTSQENTSTHTKLDLITQLEAENSKEENVEEFHFLMVKINKFVRNSVEKIERKHSVLVLEDESTLKKF